MTIGNVCNVRILTDATTEGEQVFLREGDIMVTKARFVTPGQTFAMSGITAVRTGVAPPNRTGPWILIGVGVCCAWGLGTIPIIGGIVWMVKQKPEYVVFLASASGESGAYASKDQDFVRRVADALNEAIIARG